MAGEANGVECSAVTFIQEMLMQRSAAVLLLFTFTSMVAVLRNRLLIPAVGAAGQR